MQRFSLKSFGISSISLSALTLIILLPHYAFAATGFFGPIIPSACNCGSPASAAAWGCVLATIQNLINFAISFASVIITVFLAWAGFTYMTSGGSPEKRSLANKRLMNAVIGLLITLCAWLLVNSILAVIYNPNSPNFGPWNSILGPSGQADCLAIRNPPTALPGLFGASAANNATGGTGTSGSAATPSSASETQACNGSTVQAAAESGGVQMSSTEAATLACIAGPESQCGALNQNYNWDGAKSVPPSTAWGPFQITLKGNSGCYNNSACELAAGVTGPLNCNQAFTSSGYSIPGTLLNQCKTASANLSCSAVAANCIVQANHSSNQYSAWTNNADSTAAHQACIANNGGGT